MRPTVATLVRIVDEGVVAHTDDVTIIRIFLHSRHAISHTYKAAADTVRFHLFMSSVAHCEAQLRSSVICRIARTPT